MLIFNMKHSDHFRECLKCFCRRQVHRHGLVTCKMCCIFKVVWLWKIAFSYVKHWLKSIFCCKIAEAQITKIDCENILGL